MELVKLTIVLVVAIFGSSALNLDLGIDTNLQLELGLIFNNSYRYGGLTVTPEELVQANDQCMVQNGLCPTDKDSLQYENFPPGEVPEAILCTIKCANEQLGLLKNGRLDVIKMFFGTPYFPNKYALVNCVQCIGKIETCADIAKNVECMKQYNVPKPPGVL